MPNSKTESGRIPIRVVILAILMLVCGWLVYHNLLFPPGPGAGLPALQESDGRPGAAANSAKQGRGAEALSNLDPTLRLDLLQDSRSVEYKGNSRNIFQVYIPPPPPPPPKPAMPVGVAPAAPVVPPTPAPPPIPLKFYGTAQSPRDQHRRAFLTDADNTIFIAQEGDLVAKFYRVTRVGMNMVEVEDTRTHVSQQLPLIED